ncbi:MAG TPA: putative holin [Methanosarcina sp.]|nr:putative holin [Methanosarcina sp.]
MHIENNPNHKRKRKHASIAMFLFLALTLVLKPENALVVMFKVCLVSTGIFLAYLADKLLQPQVDMDNLAALLKDGDDDDKARAVELAKATMIRRAIITLAVVIGLCLGL